MHHWHSRPPAHAGRAGGCAGLRAANIQTGCTGVHAHGGCAAPLEKHAFGPAACGTLLTSARGWRAQRPANAVDACPWLAQMNSTRMATRVTDIITMMPAALRKEAGGNSPGLVDGGVGAGAWPAARPAGPPRASRQVRQTRLGGQPAGRPAPGQRPAGTRSRSQATATACCKQGAPGLEALGGDVDDGRAFRCQAGLQLSPAQHRGGCADRPPGCLGSWVGHGGSCVLGMDVPASCAAGSARLLAQGRPPGQPALHSTTALAHAAAGGRSQLTWPSRRLPAPAAAPPSWSQAAQSRCGTPRTPGSRAPPRGQPAPAPSA